jgi:hypothetical protein
MYSPVLASRSQTVSVRSLTGKLSRLGALGSRLVSLGILGNIARTKSVICLALGPAKHTRRVAEALDPRT